MSLLFFEMVDVLIVSYDRYIRTSEPDHHLASQAIWRAMEANGDLYLDRYEGWYSVRDEAYYDESELVAGEGGEKLSPQHTPVDRKSTRLNSSHLVTSYAVFCLKKKKT